MDPIGHREVQQIASQAKEIEKKQADTELEELHALAKEIVKRLSTLPPAEARELIVKLHRILHETKCLHTLELLQEKGLVDVTYNKTLHREVIRVRPETELTDAINIDNTPEMMSNPDTPLIDPASDH